MDQAYQPKRWFFVLIFFGLLGLGIYIWRSSTPQVRATELLAPAVVVPAQMSLGTWSPFATMTGQIAEATSAPAVVSWGAGRLDLFVRGRNGELFQNYREAGQWSGWQVPPAFRGVVLRSAPTCASWGSQRISCVALIEDDRAVWHFYYDGQAWARESLGGDAWSAPTIVSPQPDQVAVFVAGAGGRLYGRGWVPGRWSEWIDFGGELRSAPACAAYRGDQVIHCFVTNTQRSISRQAILIDGERLSGSGYVTLAMHEANGNSLMMASAPAALAIGPNRIAILALNDAQKLFQTTWAGRDNVTWQPANENLPLATIPSCTSTTPGRTDCFARASDSPMLNAFGDMLQTSGTVR
ncbi:hypothetical protein [Candidatus Viridilinea mediisalina]|uniref:PLL-like beta propeller domain-containing protein n=1 Tax=Candidatus Viridilinea mediisalina TaxID=2024553 RepID=A0A2A6RJU5_9CHLR|nr:hypothetical protein [Candidatus Viridilinea mediisalina]PDW03159.1 hypothetical protein CJ255_10325 [Candidatus Viridilinea mediisalina]